MKVLFVGSNPSSKNLSTEQPFIGTPSYTVLLRWIVELGITDYNMLNVADVVGVKVSRAQYNLPRLQQAINEHDAVIALGKIAEDAVNLCDASVVAFLPHPSPRNRKLNDKAYVARVLAGTKQFLQTYANQ